MEDPYDPGQPSFGAYTGISGNKILMIGLVIIYFVEIILVQELGLPLKDTLGLVPDAVVFDFFFWQPFTYMFLHQMPEQWGFLILAFNLIGLFFFGPILESRWGRKKYLLFFLASGIFSALLYVPIGMMFRIGSRPVLGAMGPILAILVAAAMSRPNMPVLLFFVLPVKMKYMIWLFIGMDLFILFEKGYLSIARTVPHLTGAAFGFLYFTYHTDVDQFLHHLVTNPPPRKSEPADASGDSDPRPHREIDRILDKINEEGINNLSPEERAVLEEASKQLDDEDTYDPFQQNSR